MMDAAVMCWMQTGNVQTGSMASLALTELRNAGKESEQRMFILDGAFWPSAIYAPLAKTQGRKRARIKGVLPAPPCVKVPCALELPIRWKRGFPGLDAVPGNRQASSLAPRAAQKPMPEWGQGGEFRGGVGGGLG